MKEQANPRQRTIKDPLVGTTVDGRFKILAAIGQGATSSVYKAEDLSSGKIVAVKVLHSHLSFDESLVARFEREAQAAQILTHPNIVSVYEYAVSESGTPYLVMDFVDGISLQQLLARDEWLPQSVAIPIFTQICAALNEAHQKGIVHRDLKPGNIMLVDRPDKHNFVKLLDFGCAQMMPMLGDTVLKVTQTGEMLGSLLYMSPEQCLDGEVDGRSDCYSLGCVFYEAITGKPPLAARTAFETMNKQLSTMPDSLQHVRPDLGFSKELERIIFKALAKSPAQRYRKITDMLDDLLKIAQENDPKPLPLLQQQTLSENKKHESSKLQTGGDDISREKIAGLIETNEAHPHAAAKKDSELLLVLSLTMLVIPFSLAFAAMSTYVSGFYLYLFGLISFLLVSIATIKRLLRYQAYSRRISGHYLEVRKGEDQIIQLAPVNAKNSKSSHLTDTKSFAFQTKIIIKGAEKRSDGSIAIETESSSLPNKTIVIKPIESSSFFWQTFCDGIPNDKEGPKFPVHGEIIMANNDTSFLVIQKHLAVIMM